MTRALVLAALLWSATPAAAAPAPIATVDYAGFQTLTAKVRDFRAERLVSWAEFEKRAHKRNALILDARSADAYRAGHIRGAVNLPFTDFTALSLAQAIGKRDRPILIYCNNNFANDQAPVPMKAVALALNIQTFINLVGYGYSNVWELSEVVDFNDPKIGWVREAPAQAKAGR